MEVVIIMGSKSDFKWSEEIKDALQRLGIKSTLRVSSAHKVPLRVLDIIKEYEKKDVVFVTVAGKSNALSGFVDANTTKPVIACPPYSDKFSGVDVFSSLRMPRGVSPLLVLEPEQAALACAKIWAIKDRKIKQRVEEYQRMLKEEIKQADREVQ
ncbi:MAG: 5-(carboxyamino)imidazole ribonucleotide mutase [Candidatus Omnitrophota bacterium]|nr:MAG: 5-(carboxyamino)imidazole ribonucleotide mutase [Candidatus Omnitrophota bacterium]